MRRDPYCSHCGYSLKGLTESSKCPECGKPLVEVLTRDTPVRPGRRYTSELRVFGLPFVHIATGPHENERIGVARGVIAIGDVALGWIALGGTAIGGVALGGSAIGLVALGGFGLGIIALGGLAIGLAALGGGALGGIALGGGAVGWVAQGGGGVGYFARGGDAFGTHVITPRVQDPAAVQFFTDHAWLLGGPTLTGTLVVGIWIVVGALLLAGLIGVIVLVGYAGATRTPEIVRCRMRAG